MAPLREFDREIGAPLRDGEIIRSKTIARMAEGADITEHYRTKKGCNFVFVLLGVEEPGKPIDPTAALKSMGFVQKKRR